MERADVPFVSVIVPVYNGEATLGRCLRSLQGQSMRDLEVVVIDDGSTDQSGAIARRFAEEDPRFSVLRQENGGAASARNRGMAAACGELIGFADADDEVDQDFLAALAPLMEGCDCAMCGYRRVTRAGREIECFRAVPRVIAGSRDWAEAFDPLYRRYLLSSVCNKLYRRDLLERLSLLMDTSLPIGEDLVFNLDYLAHCRRIAVTDRVLYTYVHMGGRSLTGSKLRKKPEIDRRLFDAALAFCAQQGIPPAPSVFVIYLKSCFTSIEKLVFPSAALPREEIDREIGEILGAGQTGLALAASLPQSREARLYQRLLRTRSATFLRACGWLRGVVKALLQR